uniref:Interferon-induced GTP-binding protein Mx n=1 Tax=Cyclopterus lumpus TaxID=8103 RepID=A0A8C2WP70_CYCLU
LMNTMNQQYKEKVRPCIDLMDSLRSLGVEKDLALLAIGVIGDQSFGEELCVGGAVRGGCFVTRCPLELKIKRRREGEEWYGKISYQNHEEEIKDPAHVDSMIREAQNKMARVWEGISDDLSLEIASPDVQDLMLIDLPGITRVAVKGQLENIGEQINTLIQKIITKQQIINLVVVPSNVDIATTQALKMVQEVDPDGNRTLGKWDLVDKGTEESVVEIVRNLVIQLNKGYMIVRCRGQKEIMCLLRKQQEEKRPSSTIMCISSEFNIFGSLPRLKDQIEKKLTETQAELDSFGSGPPADAAERLSFTSHRLHWTWR